ncbi:alpha/beta fold hydrolase [Halosegnis marinus]|uniref:Alpha/beta fold hydrolase n=1 Tax=Halosegnis marinus TaxID=3034023 RepID=A0ABD5ZKT7_9EURY|nr:alpha/beta hydrolase [Halosegnis sp. DT85]
METLTRDGRTLAYRGNGDDPVLYVHGAGGDGRLWVEQEDERLPPAVAVDLTGHGESDDADLAPGEETLDTYARDVVAVADETGARAVVGNSMGGAVALWAVLEHGLSPDALVLCGTGAKLGVGDDLLGLIGSDFDAAVEALSAPDLLFHDPASAPVERAAAAMRDAGAAVTERDFRTCDAFDARDRLDEVGTRSLAITGEHDGMTPPSFTEYLGAELPDCEVALLDDCAHLSMLERPGAWNDRVAAFLAQ